MSPVYRLSRMKNGEHVKGLYRQMEQPGAVTWFVPLCIYAGRVFKEQILLSEACFMTAFRTYKIKVFERILPEQRSWLDFGLGLNRSNSLGESYNRTLNVNSVKIRHQTRMDWCKNSGPFLVYGGQKIWRSNRGRSERKAFEFNLVKEHFTVPMDVAIRFGFGGNTDPMVWVQWDIRPPGAVHLQKWASLAKPGTSGARLGIRIFPGLEARKQQELGVWLHRQTEEAPYVANMVVDFLEGKTLEEPYTLPDDRKDIFTHGTSKPAAPGSKPRKRRKTLAKWNDHAFVWGENEQQVFTKHSGEADADDETSYNYEKELDNDRSPPTFAEADEWEYNQWVRRMEISCGLKRNHDEFHRQGICNLHSLRCEEPEMPWGWWLDCMW